MAAISEGIVCTLPFDVRRKDQERNFFYSLSEERWYSAYTRMWKCLESKLQNMRKELSANVVDDVVKFINKCGLSDEFIPTIVLFTGTNLPDHDDLFNLIIEEISLKSNSRIVSLPPSRSSSVKYLIEYLVLRFITAGNSNMIAENINEQDDVTFNIDTSKKPRYNLLLLLEWYRNTFTDGSKKRQPPFLIIVLPDIESFSAKILQQFLLALSVYKNRLPILLIFGVATNFNTISNILPDEVLSKFTFHLFQSQPSVIFLNTVLEKVFLTSDCPFQLGSKVFEYLTHLFLYYNFSVEMFIRGLRFCLMNHFFGSDIKVLCCSYKKISRTANSLRKEQKAELLKIPSFKKFWKREEHSVGELPKTELIVHLLKELHNHLSSFHLAVRCLHAVTYSLPNSPLGFHIREIYVRAMSSDITKTTEFKKCFELLKHLSKDESLTKINVIIELLTENVKTESLVRFLSKFGEIRLHIENSNSIKPALDLQSSPRKRNLSSVKSRSELTQVLANNVSAEKKLTSSEIAMIEFWNFLIEFFKTLLKPPSEVPLNEILVYNSVDVLRNGFEGIPRAVLHHAMINPCSYLHCDCCCLSDKDEILNSFPDLCIAYKIHLECGNQINLYDWLQAFSMKVEKENSNSDSVNPHVHARFLQAVKELQFLGFIDSSPRKQDHVKKVTSC